MVNNVKFAKSEEDLALGSGIRLNNSEFCVAEVLLQCKRTDKSSDIDIRRQTESTASPLLVLSRPYFTRPTPTTHNLN